MEKRRFGRTGLDVSLLGFGCGAVGGLMVKGEPADQERAVARALELGINYFDTAQMYGNGEIRAQSRPRAEGAEARCLCRHEGAAAADRTGPDRRSDRGLARRQPAAAAARSCRSVPVSQRDRRDDFGREFQRRHRARRGRAGLRAAARAGQMPLYRHYREWRDRRAAPGRQCLRLRYRPGQLQSVEPEPGGAGAGGLSGAGLPQSARPSAGRRHGRHRDPRARRRRAERHRGAASARLAAAGADRLGTRLPRRCRTRPPLRTAGA